MVIVCVLTMPNAAARFEHDILLPPVGGLSAAGTFAIAALAALTELAVAAILARMFGSAIRDAARWVIHLWQRRHLLQVTFHPAELPPQHPAVVWDRA